MLGFTTLWKSDRKNDGTSGKMLGKMLENGDKVHDKVVDLGYLQSQQTLGPHAGAGQRANRLGKGLPIFGYVERENPTESGSVSWIQTKGSHLD